MFVGAMLGFAPPRRLTVPRDPAAAQRRAGFFDSFTERRNDPES
jgi:hypothetical protein